MSELKLAVLVSTYNREGELDRFVKWWSKLGLDPSEYCLFILDESDKKYGVKHARKKGVVHIPKTHGNDWGYAAKEEEAKRINAEYLLFTNDDARYEDCFVEEVIGAASLHEADIVSVRQVVKGKLLGGEPRRCCCDIGGFIIRKRVFVNYGFSKENVGLADGLLLERAAADNAKIMVLLEVLYESP